MFIVDGMKFHWRNQQINLITR